MGTSNNTIKRNRKIIQELKNQIARLKIELPLKEALEKYVFPQLISADLLKVINLEEDEEKIKEILDTENILLEIVKLIGIMEVSFNLDEFEILINNREQIKKKPELNNFDILLKGIVNVPKPKE